jgi:NADPH-dependent ferric siderophore reductase
MTKLPAFLARRVESRGIRCVVTRIEELTPRFRRVHLAGDGLRGHEWEPCQVTSFRVSDTEFRHYTPDELDSAAGTMSVLFYLHGHHGQHGQHANGGAAPGEAWLDALAEGDPVVAIRPGCARTFQPVREAGAYLVCGDSTTVGLWWSMLRWLPSKARVTGAVEVPAEDVGLVGELLPGLDVVAGESEPGTALRRWAAGQVAAGAPVPDSAYLSGHAQTLRWIRDLLRDQGMDRRAIRTQPYWATGKTGL